MNALKTEPIPRVTTANFDPVATYKALVREGNLGGLAEAVFGPRLSESDWKTASIDDSGVYYLDHVPFSDTTTTEVAGAQDAHGHTILCSRTTHVGTNLLENDSGRTAEATRCVVVPPQELRLQDASNGVSQ